MIEAETKYMFEYFLQFFGDKTADVVVLTAMIGTKRKKNNKNFNPNANTQMRDTPKAILYRTDFHKDF